MKESRTGADRNEIFREPWDSEDGLRSRNSLPYNITFLNGVGVFNGSTGYVTNAIPLKGIYSVRFRLTALSPSATQYLLDCRANSGTGYIRIDSATAVSASSGTIYVDGVATSTISANSKEIVVSGITISSTLSYLGRINSSAANFLNASIEIFQIYNISLTANQIKNLYNNSAYKPFIPHGEILGSELINFDATNWTVSSSTIINSSSFSTTGSGSIYKNIGLVANKKYTCTIKGTTTSSELRIYDAPITTIYKSGLSGTFSSTFTFFAVNALLQIWNATAGTTTITSISIKEVLSTANLILDVNAFKGTIRNRLSGSVLNGVTVPNIVNTNVVAVRSGAIWSQRFLSNGILNCGLYNTLLGDLSVSAFFKANSFGTSGAGKIIDNSKLKIGVNTTNGVINCTSDGSTIVTSASSVVKLGQWMHLVVLRKSEGKVSFYINEVLSGSADLNSGTPLAGSTIYIGTTASSNYFDGEIAQVQVFNGILSAFEISQIKTANKSKYNL